MGAWRLALRPDLGGSIAGLWLDGRPVLRSVEPQGLQGPRQSGSFALVPYSNRVAHRSFEWKGRACTTAANFGADNPHSLHGSAWLQSWDVVADDAQGVELCCVQSPDAHWPFAFDVRQRFELDDKGLTVRLSFTNTDRRAQPVGLGWHPYFPKRSRSRLHIECAGRWENDPATHLPTVHVAQRGIDADVRHLDFDHCFDGWQGTARIRDEAMAVALSSSLRHVVVFTPPTRDYFCVEPVSHVNDAVHAPDPVARGLRDMAPDETFEAWMRIEAHPA